MRTAFAILAVAALAACAAAPTEPARRTISAPDFVTLDAQDAIVELNRGARVHVRLESERVSGRRWHVTLVAGNAVAPYGNPWFTAKNIRALHEPGTWIFDFDAVAPGKATVTFDYRRDKEPAAAAERTAKFDFVVR